MPTNDKLRQQIFEIIKSQIKANDPPTTNVTYKRLRALGYSDFESHQLIGQCVSLELFNILKHGEAFNEKRYVKNLNQLPEEPDS
tara:strand:+ start:249 stop:503 length:255 start_codon:yes stop_codon:yes gene_type:complete